MNRGFSWIFLASEASGGAHVGDASVMFAVDRGPYITVFLLAYNDNMYMYIYIEIHGGFLKWGCPQIIHLDLDFPV
jgi:hypothetical protein